MKILLTIAYDGTDYKGFQSQKHGLTIEDNLNKTLSSIFNSDIKIIGASRTDSGVHALGQRASFNIDNLNIPMHKLPKVINSRLPSSISVMSALFVPDSLHPRHDAQKKTYIYKILITEERNPLFNRYHYCTNYNLDYINMNQACRYFIGTHDFSAFCASNSSTVNKIRTITHLSISISYIQNIGQELTVSIKGNGFLYNMVRIIVGTLIEVGRGNINKNIIPDILISKDRKRAGTTARASGLCLQNIEYKNPSIR